jgi:hypothetical protein
VYDVPHTVSLETFIVSKETIMSLFPRKGVVKRSADDFAAAEDAGRLADQAPATIDEAAGADWYHEHGNNADRAAYVLCRLRRARAGERQSPEAGDEAVRAALSQADAAAVIWVASRAISFMDENAFPEAVEPWLELER